MPGTANGEDKNRINTTDATATVIWDRILNTGDFVYIDLVVAAHKSDSTTYAIFKRIIKAYNPGSGAVFAGNVTVPVPDDNASSYALTVQISGNDLQVLVTGIAATTIEWSSRAEVLLS